MSEEQENSASIGVRKRKSLTKKTRFEVFKRDSFKCQYCGASAPDAVLVIDHIEPFSKNGADDIMNFITACQPCNAGKGARALDDNSTIAKQKQQLDELNERREQIEMMLQWRNALKDLGQQEVDMVKSAWETSVIGWGLNESGEKTIRAMLKKYGMEAVLDAIESSAEHYLRKDESGKHTQESVNEAWSKIGGFLRMRSLPEDRRRLYYIKGILRNRFHYVPADIMDTLNWALDCGVPVEEIEVIAKNLRTWSAFRDDLYNMAGR